MAEALGVAGSIIGIVAFGLKLATTLQTYVEAVVDVEQSLQDITLEVSATASALKQLQDLIEADALAIQENITPVLNATGKQEIESLGRKCETVYSAIIHLIVRSNGKDVQVNRVSSASIASIADLNNLKTKTLLRKLKWPWVEKRIKKHQAELRWLKMSLLFHLQLARLAQIASTKTNSPRDLSQGPLDAQDGLWEMTENLKRRKDEYLRPLTSKRPRGQTKWPKVPSRRGSSSGSSQESRDTRRKMWRHRLTSTPPSSSKPRSPLNDMDDIVVKVPRTTPAFSVLVNSATNLHTTSQIPSISTMSHQGNDSRAQSFLRSQGSGPTLDPGQRVAGPSGITSPSFTAPNIHTESPSFRQSPVNLNFSVRSPRGPKSTELGALHSSATQASSSTVSPHAAYPSVSVSSGMQAKGPKQDFLSLQLALNEANDQVKVLETQCKDLTVDFERMQYQFLGDRRDVHEERSLRDEYEKAVADLKLTEATIQEQRDLIKALMEEIEQCKQAIDRLKATPARISTWRRLKNSWRRPKSARTPPSTMASLDALQHTTNSPEIVDINSALQAQVTALKTTNEQLTSEIEKLKNRDIDYNPPRQIMATFRDTSSSIRSRRKRPDIKISGELATVSPHDLPISAPSSAAFTNLTSPSLLIEPPHFIDSSEFNPSFGSNNFDNSVNDLWYPLFPHESALDESAIDKPEDLEVVKPSDSDEGLETDELTLSLDRFVITPSHDGIRGNIDSSSNYDDDVLPGSDYSSEDEDDEVGALDLSQELDTAGMDIRDMLKKYTNAFAGA